MQFQLFFGLSLASLAVAAGSGVLSYRHAYHEAMELQDDQLRQTAALLGALRFDAPQTEAASASGADPESRLMILTAPTGGGWSPREAAPDLPDDAPDGLQTVRLGGIVWRIFVGRDLSGSGWAGDRLAVGQQTAARDEIAQTAGLRAMVPMVLLLLAQPVVIALILRAKLWPLRQAARELDQAADFTTARLPERGLPSEIAPFVAAIARLGERLDASIARQRRFLDAAAHELRTPLTALSLQAQRLDGAENFAEARARMAALRRGVERARKLLDQLLALARAQNQAGGAGPTAVLPMLRDALEDLAPLAQAKSIDLGLVDAEPAILRASAIDLTLVVKNLVDNAIRYTPAGGRVDLGVVCRETGVRLWVRDSGPGIAANLREKIFLPFWRGAGLVDGGVRLDDGGAGLVDDGAGLGLSIVKAVLDRLGATIVLGDAPGGGLEAIVDFPHGLLAPDRGVGPF